MTLKFLNNSLTNVIEGFDKKTKDKKKKKEEISSTKNVEGWNKFIYNMLNAVHQKNNMLNAIIK